ncbi:IclR family transcriptional regulator [Roseobacter sp.]|uniref:IclR family transcriptional regulator n=1 Tax=Roseobacter sp. TaxID=1907202 RepID=UPI003297B1F6
MDKAVVKAFGLLEILAQNNAPMGITELANKTDLGKSNVHRLLQTLMTLGYVRKPDETQYTASLKVWELGSQIISRVNMRDVARPYMQMLADATGEAVHLSELYAGEVLYIDKIESREPVRAYTQLGGRAPAYCTATGKVMLAYQNDDVINDVIAGAAAHTQKTIIHADAFLAQARTIRQQRYAINRGEWRKDVIGISAPISCAMGRVDGAIGVSAPGSRVSEKQLTDLAPQLIEYAERISTGLGCTQMIWSTLGQR